MDKRSGAFFALCLVWFVGSAIVLSGSKYAHADPLWLVAMSALLGAAMGYLSLCGLVALGFLKSPNPDSPK